MSASYLVSQGYQIVNDAYSDVIGKTNGLNDLETTDFVSMGKALDDFDLLDKWYGALTNRIIKTVVFARRYSADTRAILRDEHTFGAFVQKLYVSAPDAVANPAYTNADNLPGSRVQNSPYDVTKTLEADAFIFGGQTSWSYEFQMPSVQIKQAFLNESEMMAFVDGQFIAVSNKIELAKESLVNSAINTSIANSIHGGKVRNLLTEYNAFATTPLTRADALRDKDFLKWASKEINKAMKFMQKPSVNWNVLGYETYTPMDKMHIEVLSDFAQASQYYLESDTYHNNLVALGGTYTELPFLQSQGKTQSFEDCSAIDIINDGIENGAEFKIEGIVAILRDEDAVACYFGDEYQWSMSNPRDRVSIYGYQYKKGYAVDGHANEFVFIISDNVTFEKGTNVTDIKLSNTVGSDIEVTATFSSSKTYSAVQYKHEGDANYTTITATEDGRYLFDNFDNTKKLYVKVTATS